VAIGFAEGLQIEQNYCCSRGKKTEWNQTQFNELMKAKG
jgi:hypothetical protein